jgi:glycine/D-amino acid oxidase-like deaminating enzyme/nitrite reductase/ring-hydroxylating ferredoxin subunit
MKTTSIWENTAGSERLYPELTSHITADVVIIGGGITGLTAALLLADGGKKVVLLEALRIGLGTTGNSTGNLYSTVDEHLSVIRRKWNSDVMKSVVESRRTAIDLIEQTINRFAIDCNFVRTSFNFFAERLNDDMDHFLQDEFEALQEAGLNPRLSENPGMPFHVEKTLTVDNQAQFHPLKYIRHLAEKISDRCTIYENSMMEDLDEDEGLVKTSKGSVQAKTIIMATHTPKGNYMVQGFLGPYREFGVAAELKSGNFPTGIFWGLDVPKHSVRVFDDNGKKYILVIGDKYKTGQGDDTYQYVKRLEEYLDDRFDTSAEKMVWGGQQYRPADGLPYIGKHSDKLWFMTGFATDGLVYGTLAAMIASDDILGRPNKWADVYRLKRFTPLKSSKEFFREQVDNFAQYLKDTPWSADEAAFSELKPGEGRVILREGEKLAAYKDEQGQLEVVSAVCTHMKCIVNWNPAEKTWDCPCHGSRFKTSGEVIEGPAISALPPKKTQSKT